MHELSIAESILRTAIEHVPADSVLRGVRIRVGPLRGIDATAMDWAWRSVTDGQSSPPRLEVVFLPWRLRCPACRSEWNTPELSHHCACGCSRAFPVGGSELELESLDVADDDGDDNDKGGDHEPEGTDPCESRLLKRS